MFRMILKENTFCFVWNTKGILKYEHDLFYPAKCCCKVSSDYILIWKLCHKILLRQQKYLGIFSSTKKAFVKTPIPFQKVSGLILSDYIAYTTPTAFVKAGADFNQPCRWLPAHAVLYPFPLRCLEINNSRINYRRLALNAPERERERESE